MRISDWSSDVCSSDLNGVLELLWVAAPASQRLLSIRCVLLIWRKYPERLINLSLTTAVRINHVSIGRVRRIRRGASDLLAVTDSAINGSMSTSDMQLSRADRSEERRDGKECVSRCSSRWSAYHSKNKPNKLHTFEDQGVNTN